MDAYPRIDVRIPIGLLFFVVGVLLTIYGAVTLGEPGTSPTGIPIDLYWGIVLVLFGGAMLWISRWAARKRGAGSKDQGAGSRGV